MKKRMKKNRKGSVLLTVICFTTVCMLIASLALSLANYSTKVSNNNIRSTQAEITAQNYLQEFVSAYKEIDATTGKVTYQSLLDIAGASESNPTEVTVRLEDISGNQVDPNAAGGTCKIYVFKSGSGVVVKSEATYAGETEVASAYFGKEAGSPWTSTNALETIGGINVNGIAAPIDGCIVVETDDITEVTELKNDPEYKSHFYIENNVYISTQLKIHDVLNKNDTSNIHYQAPTFTCLGYLAIYNIPRFSTNVGKTDINGDIGTSGVALSNKDGYINVDKKLIITMPKSEIIGTETKKDFDVYCRGAYIGGIPDNAIFSDRQQILDTFLNAGIVLGGEVGEFKMKGNFYSIKGAGSGQDGNLVFANNNDATIDGSLYVDGDLYVLNSKLTVKGDLVCTGKIYGGTDTTKYAEISGNGYTVESNNDVKSKLNVEGTISDSIDTSIERNNIPALDYDPYTGGTRTTLKTTYADTTPNDMYNETNQEEVKYIRSKYNFADMTELTSDKYYCVDSTTGAVTVKIEEVSNYEGDLNSVVNGDGLIINGSCKIPQDVWKKQNAKITIKLTDSDIIVLIPSNTEFEGKIRVDTSGVGSNKVFCYFMVYDSDDVENYYSRTISDASTTPKIQFINQTTVAETSVCSMDSTTFNYSENTTDNRIFFLMPNKSVMIIGSNNCKIQGLVYGTQSDLVVTHNGSMLYGQAKVKQFIKENDGKDAVINDIAPAENSILDYIKYKHPTSGQIDLLYFTKYKS